MQAWTPVVTVTPAIGELYKEAVDFLPVCEYPPSWDVGEAEMGALVQRFADGTVEKRQRIVVEAGIAQSPMSAWMRPRVRVA